MGSALDRYYAEKKKKKDTSVGNASTGSALDRYYTETRYNTTDTSGVDQKYIDSFFTDANSFLTTAEKDYGGLGWGNATSSYDSRNTSWQDLNTRADTISAWLFQNRKDLDSEAYDSLNKSLNDIRGGGASVLDSFKSAADHYSQFKSEDEYNKWYEGYKAEQDILDSDDFKYYSEQGANIKNPTYAEANGSDNFLGWKNPFVKGAEINNIVTFSRDNLSDIEKALSGSNNNADIASVLGDYRYQYMTERQVSIYNYYLAKYGKDKANEYLKSIDETLNQEYGIKIAERVNKIDSKALDLLFAAGAGLDQAVSGFRNLDNFLMGKEAEAVSPTQFASGIVREDMDGLWGVAYDLTQTTGNMLPSIMVGSLTGGVGGAATLGTSAMGNAYADMKRLGYDDGAAQNYAFLVGASEGVLSYFLGGISKLGGGSEGIFQTIASKIIPHLDNAIARVAIQVGGNMLDEGLEEMIQEVLDPIFKMAVTGEDFEGINLEDVLYSGLLGALSAGVLEGVPTIGGTAIQSAKAKKIYGVNDGVDLVYESLAIDPDNAHAQKMKHRLDDGKNISGYQLNRLVESNESALVSQDRGKIKSATEARLGELRMEGDTSALASALTKQAEYNSIVEQLVNEGMSNREATKLAKEKAGFTRADQKLINESKYGQRVANELDSDKIKSGEYTSAWAEKIGTERINEGAYNKAYKDPNAKNINPFKKTPLAVIEPPEEKESEYKVAVDGKTKLGDTEIAIKEIASIKDGEVILRLEDDSTVNASDVTFGSNDEALIYESVAKMDVPLSTANAFVKGFRASDGVSAQIYAMDIPLAYQYGKIGYQKGLEKLNLTSEQRNTAYVLGRDDAKASGRTWSDTSRKTPETNRAKASKDGIIYDGFELNEDSLTDIQKASLAGIRTLAKMSPTLEIHITQSVVENGKKYVIVNGKKQLAKNGVFRNGNEIYIDLNAGKGATGTMLYTASHEVVHFIAENSFEDFQALADFLFEHYGENNVPVDSLIKREIDKLKKGYEIEGKELPNEEALYMKAYEEVVANAMSKMFADPTSYEKLAKLKSENLTLWEKIGEAIKHILDKLKSILGIYEGYTPDAMAAHYVDDFSIEVYNKLQDLYLKGFVNAEKNYQASIGSRNLEDFADAKNTEGESLFQYKAMEADEDTYREMLKKWGKMTDSQISNLFLTIDNAMELIKDNLEALDYAWEADIDDRAFSPVKPNSDKLYQVSLDYSTLCRKRILQQTIIAHLQEALNKPLTREEGIAIRDALIALQEEGRQIEVACALCYVESARMKSPEQIKRFIDNREAVIKEFFAGKSGGDIKANIKKAEDDTRERLHKENPNGIKGKDGKTMLDPRTAKLNQLPKKYADEIRSAKKSAKQAYTPTAEEQRIIEVAKGMTVSDFTSPEGLENLAKNYPSLFDAYTSYIRNATKSKGIENDTWWRAGDSMQIGDVLIANMNRENGLRSQSWSDFQVIHILDYIASTIELATRETKEQAYTKVPDYAELMGNTGVMINLSLIPTAKFNGTLDYDSVEGIDYKRALELRDKYHATVGTICIGVDNVQIKMLLGDATIDYVIPYHKSGMSAAIRKLMHIPTWSQYEEYQSEKNLSRADAENQAKKYGVTLLAESDPNYHKGTSFSEWFDIREAQQIAKMENANPSDKAKQKKYGVMYGGYMAMQNAANNYLKLCAERGVSPKFSHEKADFTAEENYWKLLIDRKMVDNITGEVIEQQTIKPIFDENEVMRILNDELERYPKVKADQDYAIRKVTEGMLSGKIKGGMSAKDIAKVMQTPVDNVTKTNIMASAEGDELYSVDDDFDRDYSYETLTSKNELEVKTLPKLTEDEIKKYKNDSDLFGKDMRQIAASSNNQKNTPTKTYLYCRDLGADVLITKDSFKHGAARMDAAYIAVCKNIADVLNNSIAVNEFNPRDTTDGGYVLLGMAETEDSYVIVRSIVNKRTWKLEEYEELDAIKKKSIKKEDVGFKPPHYIHTNGFGTSSVISIADFLKFVNTQNIANSVLPLDVIDKLGTIRGFDQNVTPNLLYSDQDPDSVSNRSLLANALESVAQNDIERNKLKQYKDKIALIESEQAKLSEIRGKIKELSFAKGPRDTEAILDRSSRSRLPRSQTL